MADERIETYVFDTEVEYLEQTRELVEGKGGRLATEGKVTVRVTGNPKACSVILSDLGFTNEDLEDGTVYRVPNTNGAKR